MKEFINFNDKCNVTGVSNFVKALSDKNKALNFIYSVSDGHKYSRQMVHDSVHYFEFEKQLFYEIFATADDKAKIELLFKYGRKIAKSREKFNPVRYGADGEEVFLYDVPIFLPMQLVEIYNNIDIDQYIDKDTFTFIYHKYYEIPSELLIVLINKFHDVNYNDSLGRNLLNIFITKHETYNVVIDHLIARGVNINNRNKNGSSILLSALNGCCLEVIKVLLDNNVLIDEKSLEKIKKSNKIIKSCFIERGIDV